MGMRLRVFLTPEEDRTLRSPPPANDYSSPKQKIRIAIEFRP